MDSKDIELLMSINEDKILNQDFKEEYGDGLVEMEGFRIQVYLDYHIHEFLACFNQLCKNQGINQSHLNQAINQFEIKTNNKNKRDSVECFIETKNFKQTELSLKQYKNCQSVINSLEQRFFKNREQFLNQPFSNHEMEFWDGIQIDFSKDLRQQLLQKLTPEYYQFKTCIEHKKQFKNTITEDKPSESLNYSGNISNNNSKELNDRSRNKPKM